MKEEDSIKLQYLEQSLINHLMTKNDLEAKMGSSFKRLRALKIVITGHDRKHPTFAVQIGMFSAEFNMMTGLKEKGSCFGIERYVRDWLERESIKGDMIDFISSRDKKK